MRAQSFGSLAILLTIGVNSASAQQSLAPDSAQVAACPTVLPVAEGERSIVVPSIDPVVEMPPTQAPHIASLPRSPQRETELVLLREKLAQRDQLQREIAALRESTQTPEQISVHVKMIEINRTKLRKLGIDLSTLGNGRLNPADLAAVLGVESGSTNSLPPTMGMCFNVDPAMFNLIASLERQNVSRVLATPTIVVMSGQPGALHVGSEIPVASPGAPGGVQTQKCGTQVDLTADTLGDNRVRIHIKPRVSEPISCSFVNQNGETMPALSVRQLDTAFESEFGKTTILSGLVQERTETRIDQFGRKSDEIQEIALMFIVTPQIVRK